MFENIPNLLFAVAAVALVGFFVFSTVGNAFGGPNAEEQDRVRTLLAEGDAELVDVRTPREFAANGLDGAKNIPVQQLDGRLDELGDRDQPVVVYCRSGSRSSRAAQMLEKAGFEKVYDLGSLGSAKKIVESAE
ncbi:MAG: rhodanese-like domain-containing protein [Myxococcota bacterium]